MLSKVSIKLIDLQMENIPARNLHMEQVHWKNFVLGMLCKVSIKLINLQMENIPAWNLHMEQIV